MSDISLLNLGKPANTLIEKIANAFGRHFDPRQAVRMAEAEAKAYHLMELNRAETDFEVAELRRRAASRLVNEEMTNQANIEAITIKATRLLNEDAKPEDMADDWVRNTFDKSKLVSDEDMQEWWSRIVAGEANSPGSFSKRTVNLMGDLDKKDAGLFEKLCSFVWLSPTEPWLLVFDTLHEIYTTHGVLFSDLVHLDSLGLIRFNDLTGFGFREIRGKLGLSYFENWIVLENRVEQKKELGLGKALLTQSGCELFGIASGIPIDGFYEYVCDQWDRDFVVSRVSS